MLLVENAIVPLHRKRRTKWYWIHLQLHLHWWFIFSWSTVPMTTDPWISNGRSHCRHWSIDKSASKKNYQLLQNGIARAKSCENWIFFPHSSIQARMKLHYGANCSRSFSKNRLEILQIFFLVMPVICFFQFFIIVQFYLIKDFF